MKSFLAPLEQIGVCAWAQNLQSGGFSLAQEFGQKLGYLSGNLPVSISQWESLIHPDDLLSFRDFLREVAARPAETQCRFRVRDAGGAWRKVEARGRVVRRGRSNRPLLIGGVLNELTGAEFSPELFKAVVLAASEGVWTMNSVDGLTSFVNQRMAEMLAASPADMLGKSPFEYIWPADHSFALRVIEQTMAGSTERFEVRLKRATGDPIAVLGGSAPIRDDEGKIVGAVAMFHDLTAWKEAERAIVAAEREARVSHARLAAAKDGAGAGTWELDLRTSDVLLDEASVAMHGLPAGTKMPISRQKWLSTMDANHAEIDRIITQASEDQFAFEFSTQSRNHWVLCLGRAIPDAQGTPAKVVGLNLDVTARKHAETEMTRMRAELAQVARRSAMGTMASSIAHELNQPLAAATNYLAVAEMMTERSCKSESLAAVRSANQTLLKAGEIIRRIRQGLGDAHSHREQKDLRELILSALDLALLDAEQKGIRVYKHLQRNITVLVDPIQIEQVIINLVRNAVDVLTDVPAPTISISTTSAKDRVTVHICDNGPGVRSDMIDCLFDSFASSKANGMGIGLSICRTIIEAHKGRLWLHKTSPEGATFKVELPRLELVPEEPVPDLD